MKRLMIVLVWLVVVSAPLLAAVLLLIEPKYTARAEIRVSPMIPRLVFQTEDNGPIPFYESYVNTQVSLVSSQRVLQRVLDQPEVRESQWYRNPPRSLIEQLRDMPCPPIERLKDALSVQPRPASEIIDVSFVDSNPVDAKRIVNAVLDQYIKYIGEKADTSQQRLYDQLVQEYNSMQKRIEGRETICRGLCGRLGTESPQELISAKRLRLEETRVRLGELQNRTTILEWEKTQTTADDGDAPATAAAERPKQPKYHEDAEWRQRDVAVRTIQHRIANDVLSPSNPEAVRANRDLELAKGLLQLREAQLDEQWHDRTVTEVAREPSLDYQLARARQEEQLLRDVLSEQQSEFHDLFSMAQALERENVELRHLRELFDAVRARLAQKDMERNVPGAIEIAMEAFVPSEPDKDRRLLFSGLALIPGLCLGIAAALATRKRRTA